MNTFRAATALAHHSAISISSSSSSNTMASTVTRQVVGVATSATSTAAVKVAVRPRRSVVGTIGRGLVGLTAVGAAGVAAAAYYDEGTARSLHFWGRAFPIFVHYKWVQWESRNDPEHIQDEKFNVLHDRYAPVAEDIVLDLKGFYLKLAQVVSTRDETLPPQYVKWIKKMQANVPTPLDARLSRAVVERSLGRPIEEVFSEWHDEPIGAASIGQVHKARLRKDGRLVAVKIQYPGIEHMFRSDIKTVISFSELAQPHHVAPMREIEKQFMTEFDYRGEANNLKEIHAAVMPVWGDLVQVPAPVSELCTKDVLVMEYLDGKSMVDGIKDLYRDIAKMQGKTLEQLEAEQKAKIKSGEIKFQSPEEQAATMRKIKKLLQTKDTLANIPRAIYNGTLGWVVTPLEYQHTKPPLNLGEIMQTLMAVHAWEIFQGGAFNGDPHPGNIMLLKDGRLGLVDYGQVKKFDLKTRISYAKFVIALHRDDKKEIVRIFTEELGVRTKWMNPNILYRVAVFWNDRDTDDVLQGMNVQEFMEYCEAADPQLESQGGSIMAARVSMLLRGMGIAFGMRMATSHYFVPYAEQLLKDNGIEY